VVCPRFTPKPWSAPALLKGASKEKNLMSVRSLRGENLNLGMYQLIDQERERLGIRFVSDYEIWQDEWNVFPGYEGYKHFDVERGYILLSVEFWHESDVEEVRNGYPTQEEKEKVFELGYEFISTMKLAALSVSQAAVYGKSGFSDLTKLFPPLGSDLFWQHLVQSWISLGIASDRLRTFFVQFVRRECEKQLDKRLKKESGNQCRQFVYKQAFLEFDAYSPPSTDEFRQRVSELKNLIDNIAEVRLTRNRFVHDYASREAMLSISRRDRKGDHADFHKAFKGEKVTGDYIKELADAYNVLVQAGNLVFLLEKAVVAAITYSAKATDAPH
jgi:hypothetical protein